VGGVIFCLAVAACRKLDTIVNTAPEIARKTAEFFEIVENSGIYHRNALFLRNLAVFADFLSLTFPDIWLKMCTVGQR
jgi:hypothetical protein